MSQTKVAMQKLLTEKKEKMSEQRGLGRPDKTIGEKRKKIKRKRGGGLFDGK